jgi:predicted enzyme related to lactoylglutathione lyase
MAVKLGNVVLDTADPQGLAQFYTQLTGWPIARVDGDWIDLDAGNDVMLSMQLAPDHVPPAWPDPSRPQQSHIDFNVDDMDAEHARALELGATLLDDDASHPTFRVYADPSGHPFCLCSG